MSNQWRIAAPFGGFAAGTRVRLKTGTVTPDPDTTTPAPGTGTDPGTGQGTGTDPGTGATDPGGVTTAPTTTAFSIATVRADASNAAATTVSWTLTDPDAVVRSVNVLRDGVKVGSSPVATKTFTDTTTVAGGFGYSYTAVPVDASGNTGTPLTATTCTGYAIPGSYTVSGARILDPRGRPFIPLGANIGVNQGIGGNQWGDEYVTPHTKEALDWGWNTQRVTTYACREVSWIGTGPFAAGVAYKTNDVVRYGAANYTPVAPFTSTAWNPGAQGRNFAANTAYLAASSQVINAGTIWKPKADFTSGATFNAADWNDTGVTAQWRYTGTQNIYGRQAAINRTFQAAQRYVDAGFVVILTAMDVTQGNQNSTATKLDDIEDFLVQAGNRFKNEQRVWVNVNEPIGPSTPTNFQTWHGRFYDAFRSTGARNIFVVDIMTNAQDAPWGTWTVDGAKVPLPKVYDPSVGPAFLANSGGTPRYNVVFAHHIYGGLIENADTQDTANSKYKAYFDKVVAAGLCMQVYETGFAKGAENRTDGDYRRNVHGFRAALTTGAAAGRGVLVWDGTFDVFTLKNTMDSGGYQGQGFWYKGANGDLSTMGKEFWAYCQAQQPPARA
jgi:hypothetical protein